MTFPTEAAAVTPGSPPSDDPAGRPVLVMLAAGMATRYGGGCKPLAPVGIRGEAVIDVNASDAEEAGFGRLVVVLGHTNCGAIQATLHQLTHPTRGPSRNLGSIVDRIRPAIEGLLGEGPPRDAKLLEHQAVRANIRMSANHLRHGSAILEELIAKEGLRVVGAEYSLDTGVVDFFDGVPLAPPA